MKYSGIVLALFVGLLIVPFMPSSDAQTTIGPGRILPVTPGAGTGTLDYLFFTFSNSERDNDEPTCPAGPFNGDNANTDGASGGVTSFDESYVTSMGEIQDFYLCAFPPPMRTPDEIILFLDANEAGGTQLPIDFCDIQIITDFELPGPPVAADDPANNDLQLADQNIIGNDFSLGILRAELDNTFSCPGNPLTLPTSPGSGFADYMIFTGVNPFDFDPATRVLFHIEMDELSSGGDEVFLSGSFFPFMVGGEMIPINSTPLLLSGVQTNAFYILGALSLAGLGAFATLYLNTKRKNKID